MKTNKICDVIYVKGKLETSSPILIGNGDGDFTDIDFVRDGNGEIFIPATTIVGKIRNHLSEFLDNVEIFFGDRDQEKQGVFKFYDSFISSNEKIKIREGVALDYETKTSLENSKFDYEICETGTFFDFRIEVVIREEDKARENEIENILYIILSNLKEGNIYFGAKTNRGLGKTILRDLVIKKIELQKDLNEWINFRWDNLNPNFDLDKLNHKLFSIERKEEKIEVDFEIPYSILIREYKIEEDVDASHIQCNGKSIIPGTSWAGFFRSICFNIFNDLQKNTDILLEMFGFVNEKSKESKSSKIVFDESIIEGNKLIPTTRVRIDRFTGGNIESALFSNEPSFNGKVKLNILIKEKDENKRKGYLDLIMLSLREIQNGFYAIGGETNIGRGLLKIEKVTLNKNEITVEDYGLAGYKNLMKL